MQEKEVLVFNGIAFTRYPKHKRPEMRKYFQPHWRKRKQGIQSLHQEVYKFYHGPIPPGHDIHHKDHNPLNNSPDNLEAMPDGEHTRHHNALREGKPRVCQQCGIPFLDKGMRPAKYCSDLCRSRALEPLRRLETRQCAQCGASYETKPSSPQRYCGDVCKALARATPRICEWCKGEWLSKTLNPSVRFCSKKCHDAYIHANKIGYETRACVVCGQLFDVYKSSPIKTCSRACGRKLLPWAKERAG